MEDNEIKIIQNIASNICRKYRLSLETEKDLAQDAILKILTKKHTYDPSKASYKTWLYTVALNEMINKALVYDLPVRIPKTSWQDGIANTGKNVHGIETIDTILTKGPTSVTVSIDSIDTHRNNKADYPEHTPVEYIIHTVIEDEDVVKELIAIATECNPEFGEIYKSWENIKAKAPYMIKQLIWREMQIETGI